MAEERINAGYKIIESLKATDEMEYVIGQNINAPSQYVTWRYMREQDAYYAGAYCNSLLQARKSLLERALTSVNHAMPVAEPTVPENAISRDINGEQIVFELSGDEMDHIWDIVAQENITNNIKHRIRERDDFEDNVKETVISDNEILIDEIGRKYRSDVGMGGESFWYTLDAYIDEKLPEFKIPRFSKVPLYLESWEYACLNNEREQYNQSLQETIKCRDDMQKDISDHFDGYHIPVERAINYINDYGYERVMVVLANTIQQNEWDARISAYNKDWAKSVLVPDAEKNSRRILLSCGTGLVDGVTREVRRLYEAEQQSIENNAALSDEDECDMEM